MNSISGEFGLLLAGVLFALGLTGVLIRRNIHLHPHVYRDHAERSRPCLRRCSSALARSLTVR